MGYILKAGGSLLVMASVVGLSMLGSQFAARLNDQAEKEKLREENRELTQRAEKLAMANRLLKVDYQLARLRLVKQEGDPDPKKMISVVEFWEVDDEGNPLTEPRSYRLHGGQVHVEGLVAKFEDDLIEKGDPLRGAAMFAFKSIHGSGDAPDDGFPLPKKRSQPNSYERGGKTNDFEERLWGNFWDLSHDKQALERLGLRAVHGQGVSQELRNGVDYEVRLRSTGECTIKPIGNKSPGGGSGGVNNSQRGVRSWRSN